MATGDHLRPTAVGVGCARLAGLAAAVFLAVPTAGAQPSQAVGETVSALPGFVRVGAAFPLDPGLVVAGMAGYGHRGAVVADEDNHHRAAIDVASSFRPLSWLGFAARFSGRYDRHTGTGDGSDSGWVGDPRLVARALAPVGGFWLGAQAGVWMPGRDAPSLAPSAATTDLVGLASWMAPGARLRLGGQLGFRFDRSARSVAEPELLSPSDRMALGVSDSNAVLLGLGASVHTGATEWVGEWSWDALVGDLAPARSSWPMRASGAVRHQLSPAIAAQLLLEVSLSSAPAPSEMPMEPLFPIEPRFQMAAGLTIQLGREEEGYASRLARAEPAPEPAFGRIQITVTSEGGAAVAGAEVVAAAADPGGAAGGARTIRTGADGRAELTELPPGSLRVQVNHPTHRTAARVVSIAAGKRAALAFALEPALPPGQLRGLVRSFRGKPLAAKLTVEPIGIETRCDEQGEFEVDLPPGEYDVSIEAAGYRAQERRVSIEQDGVTILNVDLRR